MKLTWIAPGMLAAAGLLTFPGCASHYMGPGLSVHHGYPLTAQGRERAYDRGHRDGMKAGMKDWRKDRRFDPWRHGRYRSADSGYRSRYGPRHLYRQAYRAGFETGYERGYGPRGRRHYRRARPRY